jgi:hypothetical protein
VLPNVPLPLQPEEPDDDLVFTVADDYLKNGGKIPPNADLRLLMRLNLAASRTTYKQSHRNHRNIMAQWLAIGGLVAAGLTQAIVAAAADRAMSSTLAAITAAQQPLP